MDDRLRVILIGGTSNIGKSTLATALAARLGWGCVSTDSLARYPGRPWAVAPDVVKPHVVEHYLSLDKPALVAGQLAHYQTLWPTVEALVRKHAGDEAAPIVLEGSGIWPDNVAALHVPSVAVTWLTGEPTLIEARILRESRYAEADPGGRRLIEKFVARSQGYDVEMREALSRLGLPSVTVTPASTVGELADRCLAQMRLLG